MNAVVFLDRDGVLIEPEPYIKNIKDVKFIKGSVFAIKKLNEMGVKVIMVTNQSSVAKGYITLQDVDNIHAYIQKSLRKLGGAELDGIYFCPSDDNSHEDKKPNPGLFKRAIKDLNLEDHIKFVVGDTLKDLEAGHRVGCKKILVMTGHGKNQRGKCKKLLETPDFTANNLYFAVNWIINLIEKNSKKKEVK